MVSGGLTVQGQVDVRCTREHAWALFTRFGEIAALIPSVEDVEVDGDRVYARVATRLGALPVSSRVTLEVVERKSMECLKAEGISYLGETVKQQIPKNVEGVSADSVGRLFLHLDLRPTEEEGLTRVLYSAEVEAFGRLKKIYQAILKTKVPGMMQEFADNLRGALEPSAAALALVEPTLVEPALVEPALVERGQLELAPAVLAPPPEIAAPSSEAQGEAGVDPRSTALVARLGLWARLVRWLRALFGGRP